MNYKADGNVITVYYARAEYARATLELVENEYTVKLELLGGYRDRRADKRLQQYAGTLQAFARKFAAKEPDPAKLVAWFFKHQVEAFKGNRKN